MGRPGGAVGRFGPSPHPLPGGPSGRPLPPPPLRLARPLDSPGEVAPDAMTASRGVCCQKRVLAARRRLRAMPSRRRRASSRPPRTFRIFLKSNNNVNNYETEHIFLPGCCFPSGEHPACFCRIGEQRPLMDPDTRTVLNAAASTLVISSVRTGCVAS